jgi:hypothetical protein
MARTSIAESKEKSEEWLEKANTRTCSVGTRATKRTSYGLGQGRGYASIHEEKDTDSSKRTSLRKV